MNVSINKRTGLPDIDLEDKDIGDAHHIRLMTESEGWRRLMEYMAFARESLLDSGKRKNRTRAGRSQADLVLATLDGFDHFLKIPARIALRAQELKLDQKENKDERSYNGE